MIEIKLTEEQAMDLRMYLMLTTQYRKKELDAWNELSNERNPAGTLRYPNAPSNAEYWQGLNKTINEIQNKLTGRESE